VTLNSNTRTSIKIGRFSLGKNSLMSTGRENVVMDCRFFGVDIGTGQGFLEIREATTPNRSVHPIAFRYCWPYRALRH
jgi:hypothetical protein